VIILYKEINSYRCQLSVPFWSVITPNVGEDGNKYSVNISVTVNHSRVKFDLKLRRLLSCRSMQKSYYLHALGFCVTYAL